MEKLIMVKYGELSTKKANINLFLKQLKDNVNFALKDMGVHIQFDKGRMFVNLTEDNFEDVLEKLKNVFGKDWYKQINKFLLDRKAFYENEKKKVVDKKIVEKDKVVKVKEN